MRNEVVEALIPSVGNESGAELNVEGGQGSRNRGRENETGRKEKRRRTLQEKRLKSSTRRDLPVRGKRTSKHAAGEFQAVVKPSEMAKPNVPPHSLIVT